MTARRFGGKTVVAGIVCLIIVGALIPGLGPYVAPLPMAALAAIVGSVRYRGANRGDAVTGERGRMATPRASISGQLSEPWDQIFPETSLVLGKRAGGQFG